MSKWNLLKYFDIDFLKGREKRKITGVYVFCAGVLVINLVLQNRWVELRHSKGLLSDYMLKCLMSSSRSWIGKGTSTTISLGCLRYSILQIWLCRARIYGKSLLSNRKDEIKLIFPSGFKLFFEILCQLMIWKMTEICADQSNCYAG